MQPRGGASTPDTPPPERFVEPSDQQGFKSEINRARWRKEPGRRRPDHSRYGMGFGQEPEKDRVDRAVGRFVDGLLRRRWHRQGRFAGISRSAATDRSAGRTDDALAAARRLGRGRHGHRRAPATSLPDQPKADKQEGSNLSCHGVEEWGRGRLSQGRWPGRQQLDTVAPGQIIRWFFLLPWLWRLFPPPPTSSRTCQVPCRNPSCSFCSTI